MTEIKSIEHCQHVIAQANIFFAQHISPLWNSNFEFTPAQQNEINESFAIYEAMIAPCKIFAAKHDPETLADLISA